MKKTFVLLLCLLSAGIAPGQAYIELNSRLDPDTLAYTSYIDYKLLGPDAVVADSAVVSYILPTYQFTEYGKSGKLSTSGTGNRQIRYRLFKNGNLLFDKTQDIFIVPRPEIRAWRKPSHDPQCYWNNEFCIITDTRDALGNSITFMEILWGDGSETRVSSNFNDTFCKKYPDRTGGPESVFIYIKDIYGGHQDTQFALGNYLPQRMGLFYTQIDDSCGNFDFESRFLKNDDVDTMDIQSWSVFFDGYLISSSQQQKDTMMVLEGCHQLLIKTEYTDGCSTEVKQNFCKESLFRSDSDTLAFSGPPASFSVSHSGSLEWDFDDPNSGVSNKITETVEKGLHRYTHRFSEPGIYKVKLTRQHKTCQSLTERTIYVTGPMARIESHKSGNIIPDSQRYQCVYKDTVFFPNNSLYFWNDNTPGDDSMPQIRGSEHVLRLWNFGDLNALQCTTDTKRNIEVNSNCNFSLDSLPKHLYPNGQDGNYLVRLLLTDTVLQQVHEDSLWLNFGAPSIKNLEIIPAYCGHDDMGFLIRWNTGQAGSLEYFRVHFDSLADRLDATPSLFDQWVAQENTFSDRNVPFQSGSNTPKQVFYPYSRDSVASNKGIISIGLELRNGKDSAGNACITQRWFHDTLRLPRRDFQLIPNPTTGHPGKDSIYLGVNDTYRELVDTVNFGIKAILSNNADSTLFIHHKIFFSNVSDSIIQNPPAIVLDKSGLYETFVSWEENGCEKTKIQRLARGHFSQMKVRTMMNDYIPLSKWTYQIHKPYEYHGNINYYRVDPAANPPIHGMGYWEKPWRNPNGGARTLDPALYEKAEWFLDGIPGSNYTWTSLTFEKAGWHTLTLVTSDSTGFKDTISEEIPVYGLYPAMIYDTSWYAGSCAYQGLFKDSSYLEDPYLQRFGIPTDSVAYIRHRSTIDTVYVLSGDTFSLQIDPRWPYVYSRMTSYSGLESREMVKRIDLDSFQFTTPKYTTCFGDSTCFSYELTGLPPSTVACLDYGNNRGLRLNGEKASCYEYPKKGYYLPSIILFDTLDHSCKVMIPLKNEETGTQLIEVYQVRKNPVIGPEFYKPFTIQTYRQTDTYIGSITEWIAYNGTLLSSSTLDTISISWFNQDNGWIACRSEQYGCPAPFDTLYTYLDRTGLNEPETAFQFYPNPTRSTLYFECDKTGAEGKWTLVNAQGQLFEPVLIQPGPDRFELDASCLSDGVYFLTYTNATFTRTGRFVKY